MKCPVTTLAREARDRLSSRVHVSAFVLCGHVRGANIQDARVGEYVSDFIGQSEAKVINAEIAGSGLQRQHGNGVVAGCTSGAMFEPPGSHRRQHRNQLGSDCQQKIIFVACWSSGRSCHHAQRRGLTAAGPINPDYGFFLPDAAVVGLLFSAAWYNVCRGPFPSPSR